MDPLSTPVNYLERGPLIVNPEHQKLLHHLGFFDFDTVWCFEGGQKVKDIPARSVSRIPVKHRGKQTHMYLKRHRGGDKGLGESIGFGHRKGRSPGKAEFNNICSFRERGLPTVVPIAAGEREDPKGGRLSFILTEDFSPYVQLETLLLEDPGFFSGESGMSRKNKLLEEIAGLARRMHRAGFNHQDFNATHILLRYGTGSDRPRLALFDLERVETGERWRWRWPIKSIARLNYTLPGDLFSQQDRTRLWLAYRKTDRMDLWAKVQWVWIQRKTRRIARHTEKILEHRTGGIKNPR